MAEDEVKLPHEAQITIYETKEFKFSKGTIIDGFPSVGLVSTIAVNYIVNQLEMEQVGVVVSPYFPPASIIRNGVPSHPVRVYAGSNLICFLSEFKPPAPLVLPITNELMNYAKGKGASLIISPEGMGCQSEDTSSCKAFGVGTTPAATKRVKDNGVELLENGMITGISGMLLNEGARLGKDVICIIAEAKENFPDAKAAVRLVQIMDKIMPEVEIDTKPLEKEAEKLEKEIKEALAKVQAPLAGHENPVTVEAPAGMYR